MRIWDLTHLEEHCGEQGSSTRQISANIVLGAHLGPFQINLQYCWPTPQARSQYVVHFRDDVAGERSFPSWGRRLSIDAPGSCHTGGAMVATRGLPAPPGVPYTTPMQGGASCYRQHSFDSWRMNAAGRVLQGSVMHPGKATRTCCWRRANTTSFL